jgi:hypothetical protein
MPKKPIVDNPPPPSNDGYGFDDERMPKSEAVRYLGEVHPIHDVRMARGRFSRIQCVTLTMQETQEEALNPKRKHVFLSRQWRDTLARNTLAIGGEWRNEMRAILEMQAEQAAADLAMRE